MAACVTSVKRGAEGPSPPRVKHKKDLDWYEDIPEARDEGRTLLQHSLFGVSGPRSQIPVVGSFTISASMPIPPSCGSFEAEEVPHLKPICSGDLHSVATFSEGTAGSEGHNAYTTEKRICPKFGQSQAEEKNSETFAEPPPATTFGPTISGG
jgi:hypothetical protein